MDFEVEKFVSYLAAALVGSVIAWIRKLCRDLNASFKKIRELENKNICLEKRLEKLEGE